MRGCHQRACVEEHDARITSVACEGTGQRAGSLIADVVAPTVQHVERLILLMMMRHLRITTVNAFGALRPLARGQEVPALPGSEGHFQREANLPAGRREA